MITTLRLPASILALLFSFLYGYAQEAYTWSNVAIGGGGFVSGIVTSKTESGLMYARTDVGGAYRWDSDEGQWTPLLDWVSEDEVGYLGVESIAIDPVEPNRVYMLVGTSYFNNGKSAILRSNDYGETFTVVDITSQFKAHGNGMGRQTGEKLHVDPNNNNILYCGTRENGLFKSSNQGSTWSRITSLGIPAATNGTNGISLVVVDPSSGTSGTGSQTIIAGFSLTGSTNLYRSNDGGTSFAPIAGAPTNLMPHRAALASDGNLYITYVSAAGPWDIYLSGKIWKYNLSSGQWTDVTPPIPKAYGGISVDPGNPNRLIASTVNAYLQQNDNNVYGDRILTSTNGGSSWVDLMTARDYQMNDNGTSWINGNSIHWAGCVEFDPFDTKQAWVVSGNGVYHTTDVDATPNTWKFEVKGLEETVPFDLLSIPNGPLLSVVGDYDGFRHEDPVTYAHAFEPRVSTSTGIAYAAQNPLIAVRVGEGNENGATVGKLFYSDNSGTSWSAGTAKDIRGTVAISADGAVLFHTPDNSANAYRSVDKGQTWKGVTGLSTSGARLTTDPVNPRKVYAYNNNNGNLMISIDKGISFKVAGTTDAGGSKIIRVAPGQEGDVWIPLGVKGLVRTKDSGSSYSKISNVTSCTAVGFGKPAPDKLYPTVFLYGTVNGIQGVYRSTDEGTSWIRVNDDRHEYGGLANGQFVTGDMNVFGRVYMSTAGRGIAFGETSSTCVPTPVNPQMQINEQPGSGATYGTLQEGDDVLLSPTAGTGGTWRWTGPAGFTSTERELHFDNIAASSTGIYTVYYTNEVGCVSAGQTFTLDVVIDVQQIEVVSANDATNMPVGSTLQLAARVIPLTASEQAVIWSVAEGSGATVSATGLVSATSPGAVTIRATAVDGSGVFDDFVITIELVTSLDEHPDQNIHVFPNPVGTTLHITGVGSASAIEVYDAIGKQILAFTCAENETIAIPTASWQPGLYLVAIRSGLSSLIVKRIVR